MNATRLALLALVATALPAFADDVLRQAADGTQRRLLVLERSESGLTLEWPSGVRVDLIADEDAWVAGIPADLVDDLGDRSVMAVLSGGRLATVLRDHLQIVQADDGRWVLADDAGAPSGIPAAPDSIMVPVRDPEPEPDPDADPSASVRSLAPDVFRLLNLDASGTTSAVATELALGALENPETLNTALEKFLGDGHGVVFFKDIDWKLKTFEAENEANLGVWFRYDKSRDLWSNVSETGKGVSGLGYDIAVEGNVAFGEVNPSDFLTARVALDYFQSRGGSKGPLSPEQQQKAVKLAEAASDFTDIDELLASDTWRDLRQLARQMLTTQCYWDAGLNVGFERDQTGDAKNFTLGGHFAFDVKGWNDRSAIGYLNVIDYPAALLRFLTGYDKELLPRGSALPTLLVRVDQVEPDGDTPRSLVGDTTSYQRVLGEIVYKAPVGRLKDGDYCLTALYRIYHEVDPSQAVQDADLDEYDYFSLAFEGEEGPFLSYSSGRQPFDDDDTNVYELGWKFDF